MPEENENNPIAYWKLDPDFEAEILKRVEKAAEEGREYVMDEAEAKDIVATVGAKVPSVGFANEVRALNELGNMSEEEAKAAMQEAERG